MRVAVPEKDLFENYKVKYEFLWRSSMIMTNRKDDSLWVVDIEDDAYGRRTYFNLRKAIPINKVLLPTLGDI